jgi:hypothetical protein
MPVADGDLPTEHDLAGTETTRENADGTAVRPRTKRTESDRHSSSGGIRCTTGFARGRTRRSSGTATLTGRRRATSDARSMGSNGSTSRAWSPCTIGSLANTTNSVGSGYGSLPRSRLVGIRIDQ